MNDFTKEELVLIQENLTWEEFQDKNIKLMKINNTLTEMINNYCDHNFEEDIHHMDIELCIKCGRREWWQNIEKVTNE